MKKDRDDVYVYAIVLPFMPLNEHKRRERERKREREREREIESSFRNTTRA